MAIAEVCMKGGAPIGNGTAVVVGSKITIKITKWIMVERERPNFLKSGKEFFSEEDGVKHAFKLTSVTGDTIKGDLTAPVVRPPPKMTVGTHRG